MDDIDSQIEVASKEIGAVSREYAFKAGAAKMRELMQDTQWWFGAVQDLNIENSFLKTERDELLEALMDCFGQSCDFAGPTEPPRYDHMCLSAFENAQELLIKYGKIKASEVRRE